MHIWVKRSADAVHAHIPWRRVDDNPDQKALLLFDPQGAQVLNLITRNINAESGDLGFEAKHPGIYLLYYLPHADLKGHRSALGPKGQYRSPQPTANPAWIKRFLPSGSSLSSANWQRLPKARIVEFQARAALDSFYPMQVAATANEVQQLNKIHSHPILLFPEDREHPIQMDDILPRRWIQNGPQSAFSAAAFRGEFYVFQIGVYAQSGAREIRNSNIDTIQ